MYTIVLGVLPYAVISAEGQADIKGIRHVKWKGGKMVWDARRAVIGLCGSNERIGWNLTLQHVSRLLCATRTVKSVL